ncbi:MAG: hypothetical protein JWN90_190 [Parcubacteria group bacterium]|nr:hypothetical protein [Parcubacteria group bacterium]
MLRYPVVRLSYQGACPTGKPGEMGWLTLTIIEFLDLKGKMSKLESLLSMASDQAHWSWKTAVTSQGLEQRLWFLIHDWDKYRQRRLLNKARKHVLRLLQGPPSAIQLRLCGQTYPDPCKEADIAEQHRATELYQGLKRAWAFGFIISKPT